MQGSGAGPRRFEQLRGRDRRVRGRRHAQGRKAAARRPARQPHRDSAESGYHGPVASAVLSGGRVGAVRLFRRRLGAGVVAGADPLLHHRRQQGGGEGWRVAGWNRRRPGEDAALPEGLVGRPSGPRPAGGGGAVAGDLRDPGPLALGGRSCALRLRMGQQLGDRAARRPSRQRCGHATARADRVARGSRRERVTAGMPAQEQLAT
mmetsp:Transcript_91278/g.263397  ORF Transcript_91278/g.263397 Transcript_91278/m.263397 type:complete len:206 (-) Transcript_91278:16-633(-)